MVGFLSFMKKKESEKDIEQGFDDSDIFPELTELKNRIEGNTNTPKEMNFGDIFNNPQPPEQQNTMIYDKAEQVFPFEQNNQIQPINQQVPFPTFDQPMQSKQNIHSGSIVPFEKPSFGESKETKEFFKSEDRSLELEKPELYIKIDDYKEVLSILKTIRSKLSEIDSLIAEIKDIKSKEMERLELSKKELENSKDSVDRVLELLKGF